MGTFCVRHSGNVDNICYIHVNNRASTMLRTIQWMFRLVSLAMLLGCQVCSSPTHTSSAEEPVTPPEVREFNGTMYAVCKMRPSTTLAEGLPKVYGHVLFKQEYPAGALSVLFHLHGFPGHNSQPRAIHIHQYGDFSDGCDSTGGHYNPYRVPHPSHPGDFGNFVADQGKIRQSVGSEATLFGGRAVLGRAVVVHEGVDDLGQGGDTGSLLHGNAGKRLACCSIGISTPKLWKKYQQRQQRSRGQSRK